MVKLIYGLAKFSNLKYGFGSKPKTLDKKKFLSNIKKFFHIFECADIYRKSIDHIKFLKDKDVHFKISKLPIKKSEKTIEDYFRNKIEYYNILLLCFFQKVPLRPLVKCNQLNSLLSSLFF